MLSAGAKFVMVPLPKPGSVSKKYSRAFNFLCDPLIHNKFTSGKDEVPLLSTVRTYKRFIPGCKLVGMVILLFITTESPAVTGKAVANPSPGSVLKKYSTLVICCADNDDTASSTKKALSNLFLINNYLKALL